MGIEVIKAQLKQIFTIINATLEYEIVCKNTDKAFSIDDIEPTIVEVARQLSLGDTSGKER